MEQPQERPVPPDGLKPWYYQYWFLYPVIVFWPVWSVLILRSPWHDRLVPRALAWAILFSGAYLIGRQIGWGQFNLDQLGQFATTIMIPGVLLTVVTQILWVRDKRIVRAAAQGETPPAEAAEPAQPRRSRSRRRGSRSGRTGRGR